MEQFLVPQFLDVEPKIIGPITVRQFVIMMACLLFLVIEYKLFDFELFLISGIFTFAIFGIFAFVKINGRPFHYFMLALLQTAKTPNMRVWNKDMSDAEIKRVLKQRRQKDEVPEKETFQPKFIERGKLSELSLIVNTGGVYKPDSYGEENQTIRDIRKNQLSKT